MNKEDVFYQAMLARDNRFDGKFFVGVKTTGIYCRPICPAKPLRKNVEFFATAYAAEKAGYRPCLRCRPEVAPQSPAWTGKSAVVQRALKKIHSSEVLDLNEDSFAETFGVGARHLRRLFTDEIGKTPKQIAFEHRLNLSRKLIVETNLPITEIAYASGFGSIRRFNDSFKIRFSRKPSELRRKKTTPSGPLVVSLPYRPPYDFERLLGFYRSHSVGNLERFEPGRMIRIIRMNGHAGHVVISDDPKACALKLEIDFPHVSVIHAIISRVRRLFDLDSDPLLIANAFEADAGLSGLFKKYPGVRIPTGWDPFEVAIGTILGQLISVKQATRLVADLIEHYGEESDYVFGGEKIKFFPGPKKIMRSDLDMIKTTGKRKETLRNFAGAVLNGDISLESTQNVDDFRGRLLKIKGIGPWTADYMALKVLGHTDAFPSTDLVIAKALLKHSKKQIELLSPWRGYAAILLWCEYSRVNDKKEIEI